MTSTSQRSLFEQPVAPPPTEPRDPVEQHRTGKADKHEKAFAEFLAANPEFMEWFIAASLAVVDEQQARKQKPRVSAKRIFERLRWDSDLLCNSGDGFKLNNSWTALAARRAEAECERLVGTFEFRRRKGET